MYCLQRKCDQTGIISNIIFSSVQIYFICQRNTFANVNTQRNEDEREWNKKQKLI